MNLSIIIPSYNTRDLLDRCLTSVYDSLKHSIADYEIIVVDNASKDGSIELLNKKYPRVRIILNKKNLGYGKANNLGIKQAKGKHILLLNSDIVVLGGSIEKLYHFTIDHPKSFVGGKLLSEDESPQASCGPMYTLPVVFAMLFLKGDTLHLTRYSPDSIASVDWVSGACIMAKRQSFVDVGLFDEGIFLYMEEIDLLYRAKQRGFVVLFYPEATFIHTGAASSLDRRTPVINIYRGLLYFYRKHRSLLEQHILLAMLRVKAHIAIVMGRLLTRKNLTETYEQGLTVIS